MARQGDVVPILYSASLLAFIDTNLNTRINTSVYHAGRMCAPVNPFFFQPPAQQASTGISTSDI